MSSMLPMSVKRVMSHRMTSKKSSQGEDCQQVDRPGEAEVVAQNAPADLDMERVSWFQLQTQYDHAPAQALERWDALVEAAKGELTNGIRAARTVEGARAKPQDRARYFALREQLAEEWEPQNGIETTLVDSMAQAQTMYLFWLETMTLRATLDVAVDNASAQEEGAWTAPRVGEYRGIDQAALLADRFHRVFVRSVRALTEFRRRAPLKQSKQAIVADEVDRPDADDQDR